MGVQFVRGRIGDSLGVDGVVVVADCSSVAVDHAAQILKRPVARIPQTLTVALNNSRTLLAVAILLPISDNICGADRATAAEGVTEIGQVAITGREIAFEVCDRLEGVGGDVQGGCVGAGQLC